MSRCICCTAMVASLLSKKKKLRQEHDSVARDKGNSRMTVEFDEGE
uniref:Uncharacterized protein n=1 Tax=Triticum urartu TaxID=4572 RepID=A0A8R7K164_TRIUA